MDAPIAFATKVTPELAAMVEPIKLFTRHPDNVRKHDIPAIARSLDTFGQRTPIVVQESTGYIVKGNGTHEAAELLGWDGIAVSVQALDDNTALAYLFADNKASDLAKYDRDKTVAGLRKLTEGPGLFSTLWTVEELEELEGPVSRPVGEFKGTYADAGEESEARKTDAKIASGSKMKEIPVTLTLADHAQFIDRIKRLQKLFGTSGVIATIVEAVRRQAEDVPAEQANLGDLEGIRKQVLTEARDYFLTDGRPNWSMGAVAAFFQTQLSQKAPATAEPTPETDVVPGQQEMELL